jgi:hypothetical protein
MRSGRLLLVIYSREDEKPKDRSVLHIAEGKGICRRANMVNPTRSCIRPGLAAGVDFGFYYGVSGSRQKARKVKVKIKKNVKAKVRPGCEAWQYACALRK